MYELYTYNLSDFKIRLIILFQKYEFKFQIFNFLFISIINEFMLNKYNIKFYEN